MSALSQRTSRRNLPVRLCDIREDVRLQAARQIARRDREIAEDVLVAAIAPSSRVYFVSADAAPILQAVAARGAWTTYVESACDSTSIVALDR